MLDYFATDYASHNAYIGNDMEHKEHILVVDDSKETVRYLADTLLPSIGYTQTSWALDGVSALKVIDDKRPDLVMLDLNMPTMDGMDVLGKLAKNSSYQPLVVLMTGDGSEQVAIDAFRLGVRGYLMKPFVEEEVEITLQETLERHKAQQKTAVQPISAPNHDRCDQRWEALLRTSLAIMAQTDQSGILEQVVQSASAICGADYILFTLGDKGMCAYDCAAETFTPYSNSGRFIQQVQDANQLLHKEEPMMGLDVGLPRPARVALGVPITINQRDGAVVNGVLAAAHTTKNDAFDETEQKFLLAISQYMEIALANIT